MREKYAELKSDLLKQINYSKMKYETEKINLQSSYEKQKNELTTKHEQEVQQLKNKQKELIRRIKEQIKPDRFVEAQIKLAEQDIEKTLIERDEKVNLIEESAFNQIQPINQETSELETRIINLQAEIEAFRNASQSTPLPKVDHKKQNKKYNEISTREKEKQMEYDYSLQKIEKREMNVQEILEFENEKVRRQIQQKKETIDLQIELIAQIKSEHKKKMIGLKKQIYNLTKEGMEKPKQPSTKKKIPRIKEKIEFFEIHKRELRMKLAEENEKMKRLRERNRELTFEVRRKQFARGVPAADY